MIKDIVVKLERDAARDGVSDFAVSLAEIFEAHLTGVAFGNAGIPSFVMPDVPSDVLASVMAENETVARKAVERFEALIQRHRVAGEPRLIVEGDSGPPDALALIARRCDLSVVMQSDHHNGAHNDLMIEAVLFNSGRPVVIVPYIHKGGVTLNRVICCWDGSRTAARAINDALPFLRRAKTVEIFIVANEKTKVQREIRGADIARHLARHGVTVEIEITPAADIDVASIVLSHAADLSADMLVMGGYGHSRLREFMLGGVTRGILETMTVPVFMSH
ncbi:MAG: universal stress protein [Xanthobacteraceae bacterium]|nr:universal stress protein [Xanthobacteraceae bacterium]